MDCRFVDYSNNDTPAACGKRVYRNPIDRSRDSEENRMQHVIFLADRMLNFIQPFL
jgi:hypothetical protein